MEYVGLSELAKMVGVSRQRAAELVRRSGFPNPVETTPTGRVWNRDHVAEWIQRTPRRRGRPRLGIRVRNAVLHGQFTWNREDEAELWAAMVASKPIAVRPDASSRGVFFIAPLMEEEVDEAELDTAYKVFPRQDEEIRDAVLAALLSALPADQLPNALNDVRLVIKDEERLATALVALAPRLPRLPKEVLVAALDVARYIRRNDKHRIAALTALLPDPDLERNDDKSEIRLWLARELHDIVARTLTAMLVEMEQVRQHADTRELEVEVEEFQQSTRKVLEDLSRLVYELRGQSAAEPDPTRERGSAPKVQNNPPITRLERAIRSDTQAGQTM